MQTQLVADIGNSRMKWGRCAASRIADSAALAPDNPDAWRAQISVWNLPATVNWTVAGVNPMHRDQFVDWARRRGDRVCLIEKYSQIPLKVNVEAPEQVGIDRLLGVLAIRALVAPGEPAIVVDAGSAITVNLLDDTGGFGGGAIFPGLRLMAEALHTYTAQLPLIDARQHPAIVPAGTTATAIAAGLHWAAVGGIHALIRALALAVPHPDPLRVFLTGGDATDLLADLPERDLFRYELKPMLTLEGIRLVAEGKA
jgi:type III pantothenate kinase